ncbi:MAG: hypothetical protein ABSB70_15295 [Candidatus Velthaea sp.]
MNARVVFLFRDQNVRKLVHARHRQARIEALQRGIPEVVDPQTAPPDELAARRARKAAVATP